MDPTSTAVRSGNRWRIAWHGGSGRQSSLVICSGWLGIPYQAATTLERSGLRHERVRTHRTVTQIGLDVRWRTLLQLPRDGGWLLVSNGEASGLSFRSAVGHGRCARTRSLAQGLERGRRVKGAADGAPRRPGLAAGGSKLIDPGRRTRAVRHTVT